MAEGRINMAREKKEKRFKEIVYDSEGDFGDISILVDRETGIQYVYASRCTGAAGMTILLDEKGQPLINEELKRKKE